MIEPEEVHDRPATESDHQSVIMVHLSQFAMERLHEQAALQGVSVGELSTHAIVYYLADVDSGRISWKVPGSSPRPAV